MKHVRINGEKAKKGGYGGSLLQRELDIARTSDENNNAYADNCISTVACNDKVKHL